MKGLLKWMKKFVRTLSLRSRKSNPVQTIKPSDPNTQAHEGPGLSCPRCSHRFPITVGQILSLTVFCPNCKLKLDIDQGKSAEALSSIKKLQADFEIANEMVRKSTITR